MQYLIKQTRNIDKNTNLKKNKIQTITYSETKNTKKNTDITLCKSDYV